ncbi:MAG TPA: hypothetical protein DCY93_02090 [Firmicutes bacterium]|nr:hypothetical protein [Bacillota bacterium]
MGEVTIKNKRTPRGYLVFSPWNDETLKYTIFQIALGYNPISKLEIVSSLNIGNYATAMYLYSYTTRTKKYNPKVYLSAVETMAYQWTFDRQNAQNDPAEKYEKSGSLCNIKF